MNQIVQLISKITIWNIVIWIRMFNLACPVFCQQMYHHINEKQIKSFLFVHVVGISSLCSMLVLVCWNFFTFRLNSLICSQWQLINNCSLSCLFLSKTVDLLNCTFLKNEDLQIKLFEAFYWESSLVFPQKNWIW